MENNPELQNIRRLQQDFVELQGLNAPAALQVYENESFDFKICIQIKFCFSEYARKFFSK